MTAKDIDTKRQPPLWGVKAGNQHRAVFSGVTLGHKPRHMPMQTTTCFRW